jgi:hypothetical protein
MNPNIRVDREAVKKLAREMAPAYSLYNPSPDWFVEQYNGSMYYFPPDLGGALSAHPAFKTPDGSPIMVKGDGILRVKDRYGLKYGKRAIPLYHPEYGYPMGYGLPVENKDAKIEEESADKVVIFFTQKFGIDAVEPTMAIGITLLSGNEEVDEQVKAESKKAWVEAHRQWAEGVRSNRVAQVKKWRDDHPGKLDAPPMSARQRRAEEILMSAEEHRVVSSLQFICEHGDFETDDQDLFMKHITLRHPEKAREIELLVAEQRAKRPRGRPKTKTPEGIV